MALPRLIRRTSAVAILLAAGACGGADEAKLPTSPEDADLAGVWTAAAALPEPVPDAGAAAFKGRLYVVGGARAGEVGVSARVLRYDPSTDRWERLPDLPQAVMRPGVAVVGDTLLVMGGNLVSDGLAPVAQVWRWDDPGGSWLSHGLLPVPASSPVVAGTPFSAVATNLDGLSATVLLASASREWTLGPEPPLSVDRLVPAGDAVWAVGVSSAMALFVPGEGRWTDSRTVPGNGFVLGAWYLAGRVHLALRQGGAVDHLALEPASGVWSPLAPPPASSQRNGAVSATLNGKLYLIGGADGTGPPQTRVDVFSPG